MDIVTVVGHPDLKHEQNSDAGLCQNASFNIITSPRHLKFTGMVSLADLEWTSTQNSVHNLL